VAGLEELKARHRHCLSPNKEHFYGMVNKEGLAEYGPSFQVVTSLHGNFAEDTFLGCIEFDSEAWARQGGLYGVQLLDALYQLPFLLPSHDPSIVAYAGGFEVRMPGDGVALSEYLSERCWWLAGGILHPQALPRQAVRLPAARQQGTLPGTQEVRR
jgi:hypothetical protein